MNNLQFLNISNLQIAYIGNIQLSYISNLQIVYITMAISTIISMLYLIWAFAKRSKHRIIIGFCMIISPLVGPLFFSGTFVMTALMRKEKDIQQNIVNFSKERHLKVSAPDVSQELTIVPLEESFMVSPLEERRRHLLDVLKKSNSSNYTVMLKGLDNEDTETVHYAASTISKAKENFENNIRQFDLRYSTRTSDSINETPDIVNSMRNSPDRAAAKSANARFFAGFAATDGTDFELNHYDLKLIREYTDYLLEYINSGILINVEKTKYRNLYVSIIEASANYPTFMTEQDYINLINELILLEEYEKAEEWANRAFAEYETEAMYITLAKYYYCTGKSERFSELLDQLKKSDITFSEKTLDLVRFFSNL